MIRLNKKWYNPLYFILNQIIKDTSIRTVLIYGGKSSAKTVSICQLLVKECYVKQANSIAYRKESVIIPTTLKKSFNLAIDNQYLHPAFEKQDRRYLCTSAGNGISEIVLKGLDDPEKAKGLESYKYVYLDELNQFQQTEFEQFNLSLRGIEGQKIFASWNPVDSNSWVKTDLVDMYEFTETDKFGKLPSENSFVKISSCGKVILIKTTYLDNYWVCGSPDGSYGYRDENLIAEYEGLATKNANSYKVNVLGEWGKTVFGGEFLKCWRSETHAGNYPYDSRQAIYLYFDENVNPYFPCGFFQVGRDLKSPRLIDIIAAENPNNKISWMCREISRKLIEWGHAERVYIGGDATSQKEDVKLEKGDDMFRLIMNGLSQFKPERKTTKSNPSVRMSADFFNSILEGAVPGMSFGVNIKCRKAILDFENTKEDKNGKIDKKAVTNPITKISYQPYGHFVDLTRYFLANTFAEEYERYQRGNKIFAPVVGKNFSKNTY
ncbi:MAG TPA: phage terminase large subunit [Hanamia sp.]|nr:phage terminase large subunit [Hanamia sp.]